MIEQTKEQARVAWIKASRDVQLARRDGVAVAAVVLLATLANQLFEEWMDAK